MPARTYYEILRISPTTTDEEIKAAYRALAWNPADAGGQEELKLINEAYSTLSSPGRRAAYDQALAEGTAAVAPPAPVFTAAAAAMVPPAYEEDEPVLPGPLLLRLWGRVVKFALELRRARYRFMPMTWIVIGMLIFGFFYVFDQFVTVTNEPTPTKTTIHDIITKSPAHKYVAVVGTADYEDGYESKGKVDERYYLLVMGKEILLFTGYKTQASGQWTGLLKPIQGELRDLVLKDAKGEYFKGYSVSTLYYLDTTYKPTPVWILVAGMAAILLCLLALIGATLKRYAVFVAEPALAARPPAPGAIAWPVRVEATGKFAPDDRKGWHKFEALYPAQVCQDDEPGGCLVVLTWFNNRLFRLPIPAHSRAQVGLDHTGGKTRPALKIRAGRQTVYLRMESMADARRIAQVLNA